jgi:hypothetical protein
MQQKHRQSFDNTAGSAMALPHAAPHTLAVHEYVVDVAVLRVTVMARFMGMG